MHAPCMLHRCINDAPQMHARCSADRIHFLVRNQMYIFLNEYSTILQPSSKNPTSSTSRIAHFPSRKCDEYPLLRFFMLIDKNASTTIIQPTDTHRNNEIRLPNNRRHGPENKKPRDSHLEAEKKSNSKCQVYLLSWNSSATLTKSPLSRHTIEPTPMRAQKRRLAAWTCRRFSTHKAPRIVFFDSY